MNDLVNLIRPDLREFQAYSSARDEAKHGKIWLNANESPYEFKQANGVTINRYPVKQPVELLRKVADIFKTETSQIILTRGSDEIIDLLTRLFCTAGQDAIMICTPTFGMYGVYAKLQGASVYDVPLIKHLGYQLNLSAIQSCWNPKVKIIFLCSPNNPTGNLLKVEDILLLCNRYSGKSIVVVDEAYIDFSDAESLFPYIKQYSNLVILRTLSKAYGLAGARCGVLLAQEELVQWVLKIIAPYPLSSIVTKVIYDALSINRLSHIKQQIADIKLERSRLFDFLRGMRFVKNVWPSEANFIFVEVDDVKKIMEECAKNGIVIRSFDNKQGLNNHVRISIGLPIENLQLINTLREMDNNG